jgi:hypothetical protein
MILVLAGIADRAAVTFADELAGVTAASLFTCRDLAERPFALHHPNLRRSALTIGNRTIPLSALRGVVNLLPAVSPAEIVFYPPEERDYQAAELHALLTALLAALPCRVVNRATPASLTGPFNNPLGWHRLARRLGIPTAPLTIDSAAFVNPFTAPPDAETIEVGYLAGSLITPSGTDADEHTGALAQAAGVEYLRAVYTLPDGHAALHSARTVPNVREPATRRALLELFASAGSTA